MQARARSRNWIRAGLRLGTASLMAGLGMAWVAVLPAQVASAAVFSVTNCNDSGAGSLRAEVAAAPSGHAITFASSVTSCSPILLTSGPITLTKNVTITGPGASALAISGGGSVQVFSVSSAVNNSAITGLAIENGNAGPGSNGANTNVSITASNGTADPDSGGNGGNGGGIYSTGTLTLTDSTVSGGTTGAGGTAGNDGVTATGTGDTFNLTGGTGGGGGGLYNDGTGTITAATVSANSASDGGDISFGGSALTLTDTPSWPTVPAAGIVPLQAARPAMAATTWTAARPAS